MHKYFILLNCRQFKHLFEDNQYFLLSVFLIFVFRLLLIYTFTEINPIFLKMITDMLFSLSNLLLHVSEQYLIKCVF